MAAELLPAQDGTAAIAPPPQCAYPNYFADPFAWKHKDEFFAIGTGEKESEGHPGEMVFPLLRSSDLRVWEPAGRALLRPDPALGVNFWAPEVAFNDGKFHLYYSVGFGDARHQLRVATCETALGPYQDVGTPLISPDTCPFAIDASPFLDEDGEWYLFFARDYLDRENGRTGTGLAVAPMKSMTELGKPQTVIRPRHDWQRFEADRTIYGESYDWHTVEGPCIRKRNGKYYCLYSAGRWENDTYGVDFAVADHVMGPYSDAGNEYGPRVLRTLPGTLIGPGHNSIVTDSAGEDWIVYHAWDPGMTGRRMHVDRLTWTVDGPRCERFWRGR